MNKKCGDFGGISNNGEPCNMNAGAGTDHKGEGKCMKHEISMKEKYGITESKVEMLAAAGLPLCSKGNTVPDIKGFYGIAEGTWYNLVERHPELHEAYTRGRAKASANIGQSLFQRAKQGDGRAQEFYLKCQAGWKPTQGHEISGPEGRPIAIEQLDLSHLSNEELAEIEEKITRDDK